MSHDQDFDPRRRTPRRGALPAALAAPRPGPPAAGRFRGLCQEGRGQAELLVEALEALEVATGTFVIGCRARGEADPRPLRSAWLEVEVSLQPLVGASLAVARQLDFNDAELRGPGGLHTDAESGRGLLGAASLARRQGYVLLAAWHHLVEEALHFNVSVEIGQPANTEPLHHRAQDALSALRVLLAVSRRLDAALRRVPFYLDADSALTS